MRQRQVRPRAKNRTIVRTRWLRGLFSLLDRVSPWTGAWLGDRLFFTPPSPRRSEGERLLGLARRFSVRSGGRRIAAWRWGSGPAVVMLHGWGGRGAQWTSFVAPLVHHGFSVVAFDAPGHGASGRGLSSAVDFARALRTVVERSGGAHAIVAHSLGASAVALALRQGLLCRRVVFVGPAADPPSWIERFANTLGISPRIAERMRQRSERRLAISWAELSIVRHAPAFDTPLLVVHDRDDQEVPWTDGAAIAAAWPGARLLTTSGLGHNRVLRDPGVVAEAVEFVTGDPVERCPSCGEEASTGWCSVCVENQLFNPAARRDPTALSA
jgi:pimeloyl-ACP methyl ester carboxylesterase